MSTVSRRTLSPHQPRALAESNGVCGRLLVVDDNEDFLVALRMLLANTSHEVVCADDGLSALQQAERTEFDLLLTDVRMHPMDGVTLAGRVKELQPFIAVIMMTGFDKGDTPLKALRLGASDYIDKPIRDVQAFFRLLDHHVKLVHSEKQLRATTARLETVIRHVDAGVVVLDRDGRLEQLNEVAHRLLVPGADPLGKPWEEVCVVPELKRLATSPPQSVTLEMSREGKARLLHVDATTLHEPTGADGDTAADQPPGRSLGMVLLIKDITQLAETQKAEGWRQMSRVITHGMKTPLATLRLRLERLHREWGGEQASPSQAVAVSVPRSDAEPARAASPTQTPPGRLAGSLQEILGVVDELHRRVADLMEFVKLDVVSTTADLNATVANALKQFAPHCKPGVVLDLEPDETMPPLKLAPKAIILALENLLANSQEAIAHGGRGCIHVRTQWDASASAARLVVEDDGPGIPEAARSDLFRRPTNSTKPGGSGLGTALVKYIVEQHGGDVAWESPTGPEGGTRVTLSFPG